MIDLIDFSSWGLSWSAAVKAAIALGIALLIALVLHRVIFAILKGIASKTNTEADTLLFAKLYRPMRWSFIAVAISLVAESDRLVGMVWDQVARFVVPALLGWVVLSIVRAFTAALELQAEAYDDLAAARSRKTRVAILSRLAAFGIIFVTVGLMLLGIPQVRNIGVTLMASAGLAALAVGAAAQPALKSLISGLQMAITEPLRLGDLIVVDGHTGRVEEIRMSFVVMRIWDERAVIVPTSRFFDDSFENWSRQSEKLTGPVFLHLDPATQVEPIRTEFIRFLEAHELWDGRTAKLLMTEAYPESIELRLAISANTIGTLFELRCIVREHMVGWLRTEMPDALIHHRLEVEAANAKVAK
ncbi:mechanosensitive ion channel domain-containing protein [Altererythrobacter sp. ZODW24]|uniref:mechanosensitive ion channel family protein n=1 Tax=Altererythrobacter sp. ZODW24 TaxID=2185142 RepID=UPI000DF78838|nr:mechanosensitive ion channel domain-containing protein [Altererythrobacter sp. ZODW24]